MCAFIPVVQSRMWLMGVRLFCRTHRLYCLTFNMIVFASHGTLTSLAESNASQTLRVGYGRFISDFVEQLEFAKERTGVAEETDAVGSKGMHSRRGAGEEGTKGKMSSRLRKKGGVGPLAVLMGLGEEAGVLALIRLQRFGGKCLGRSLAHGG